MNSIIVCVEHFKTLHILKLLLAWNYLFYILNISILYLCRVIHLWILRSWIKCGCQNVWILIISSIYYVIFRHVTVYLSKSNKYWILTLIITQTPLLWVTDILPLNQHISYEYLCLVTPQMLNTIHQLLTLFSHRNRTIKFSFRTRKQMVWSSCWHNYICSLCITLTCSSLLFWLFLRFSRVGMNTWLINVYKPIR